MNALRRIASPVALMLTGLAVGTTAGNPAQAASDTRRYFAFEPAAVFNPRRLPDASVLCGPLLFALPKRQTSGSWFPCPKPASTAAAGM